MRKIELSERNPAFAELASATYDSSQTKYTNVPNGYLKGSVRRDIEELYKVLLQTEMPFDKHIITVEHEDGALKRILGPKTFVREEFGLMCVRLGNDLVYVKPQKNLSLCNQEGELIEVPGLEIEIGSVGEKQYPTICFMYVNPEGGDVDDDETSWSFDATIIKDESHEGDLTIAPLKLSLTKPEKIMAMIAEVRLGDGGITVKGALLPENLEISVVGHRRIEKTKYGPTYILECLPVDVELLEDPDAIVNEDPKKTAAEIFAGEENFNVWSPSRAKNALETKGICTPESPGKLKRKVIREAGKSDKNSYSFFCKFPEDNKDSGFDLSFLNGGSKSTSAPEPDAEAPEIEVEEPETAVAES